MMTRETHQFLQATARIVVMERLGEMQAEADHARMLAELGALGLWAAPDMHAAVEPLEAAFSRKH